MDKTHHQSDTEMEQVVKEFTEKLELLMSLSEEVQQLSRKISDMNLVEQAAAELKGYQRAMSAYEAFKPPENSS